MEIYCRTVQVTDDDNMVLVHCMLDTKGYKHILRTSEYFLLSIATMVAQLHLIGTLYVCCLSGCNRGGECLLCGMNWVFK